MKRSRTATSVKYEIPLYVDQRLEPTLHISLIVSSKVTIWRDDFVDLRFIVSHAELRSQQGALDVFCH